MKISAASVIIHSFVLLLVAVLKLTYAASREENFLQCLFLQTKDSSISTVVFTDANATSYASVLNFSIQNIRFLSSANPIVIVTPLVESHVQASVVCARKNSLQIRTRSGGHDFEGLSYLSSVPYVIVDLLNLSSIDVNVRNKTAWVQAGATLGQIYYRISQKSRTLGFPAGICPTVGTGGHFGGGGWGMMLRKYGLAADNIVDARLVDVRGRIVDRARMGEDLFWAIRGGGAYSFGIVVSWTISLVEVPSTVSVFRLSRTDQNATKLVHLWQDIAHKLDENLLIRIFITTVANTDGSPTILAQFRSLFLGRADRMFQLVNDNFPELQITMDDITEMSWVESALFFQGFPNGTAIEALLSRVQVSIVPFKAKSDFVMAAIPESGIEGLFERLFEVGTGDPQILFTAFGGKMAEIPATATPYPHRKGILYQIQYLVGWSGNNATTVQQRLDWSRRLYTYMTPFVTDNPRQAYLNYRDLDLGTNNSTGRTSSAQASIWGRKYFVDNFDKLVRVKTMVDPSNFFRNEQSIPSLLAR